MGRGVLGVRAVGPAAQCRNACHEFVFTHGFGAVVVGTAGQGVDNFLLELPAGQEQDGDLAVEFFPHVPEDFDAADVGHVPVEDQQVEGVALQGFEQGFAGGENFDRVFGLVKQVLGVEGQDVFVFEDGDVHGVHRSLSAPPKALCRGLVR